MRALGLLRAGLQGVLRLGGHWTFSGRCCSTGGFHSRIRLGCPQKRPRKAALEHGGRHQALFKKGAPTANASVNSGLASATRSAAVVRKGG